MKILIFALALNCKSLAQIFVNSFEIFLSFNFFLADSEYTNTKSLAKEFSKILIFEYFGYLKTGINADVFFDADSESPRMT